MAQRPKRAPGVSGQRRNRNPQHHFALRTKPFQIQPFFIAPVLPGETMSNLSLQSRVVSDPVKNPLIGWWQEYYFFYVKHRDLDNRDNFTEMMLDPDYDTSPLFEPSARKYNHAGDTINWARLCLKRVVEEYFRNEGETWDQFMIDGLPVGQINREDFNQSLIRQSDYSGEDDIDVDLDQDGVITADEVDKALRMWQFQIANNLTDMSYEDFLATYGIRQPRIELHKPELLRYIRNWTYPSNTINPENGSPSSALSWSIQERADKDRFFQEPGFVFGVTITRPKIYMRNLAGSGVGMLNDAISWLPALMMDDPRTSLKYFEQGTGPVPTVDDGYYVDLKDLFMYGDQFINFDVATETGNNLVNLPNPQTQRKYASWGDVDALFHNAGAVQIRQDGIINMTVRSFVTDTTPGTPVTSYAPNV